jgi:hypothetical protein
LRVVSGEQPFPRAVEVPPSSLTSAVRGLMRDLHQPREKPETVFHTQLFSLSDHRLE